VTVDHGNEDQDKKIEKTIGVTTIYQANGTKSSIKSTHLIPKTKNPKTIDQLVFVEPVVIRNVNFP